MNTLSRVIPYTKIEMKLPFIVNHVLPPRSNLPRARNDPLQLPRKSLLMVPNFSTLCHLLSLDLNTVTSTSPCDTNATGK
jgi:hypothetical protein